MIKFEEVYIIGWLIVNILYWLFVIYFKRIDIALLISVFLILGSFYLRDRIIYLHRMVEKQEAKRRIGHWQPFSDGIEMLKARISHLGGMPPLSYSLTFILAIMSGMKYGWRDWITAIPTVTFILIFISVQVAIAAGKRETNNMK